MDRNDNLRNTILVIDDEKKLASLIARILELEGYKVLQAHTGKSGLKLLESEDVLVVISDVKLPDVNGIDMVRQLKEKKPYVEVISLTAYGTISDGVRAIQNGGFDYITKGDDNDKIIPLVSKAMEKARLQVRLLEMEARPNQRYSFDSVQGRSSRIKEAIQMAKRVAATDTTVLLLGETGTGKEVFAGAIHHESQRRNKPFVAVNCSSFPAELLESELFGYKAGAFTGANKDKKGLLEEAHHGTIFLDEIGEISLNLQAKLLRVLETRSFIKVGDTQVTKVDVRIIAATNRDLQKEADAGRFRLDLYYRLSVFTLTLPSLNERNSDINVIADYFLKEFAAKANKPVNGLSEEFMQALVAHHWKGNIRELKNVMERAVILADDDVLTPEQLPPDFNYPENSKTNTLDLANIERQHIEKVLAHTRGNKTETARLLGIGLTTLYRKLDEYKLM